MGSTVDVEPEESVVSTQPGQEPGTAQAAESDELNGYGNDTGFAEEAEQADEAQRDETEGTGATRDPS